MIACDLVAMLFLHSICGRTHWSFTNLQPIRHYVSPKGDERIQVEWFNEKHHLRATNLAFVRRIRVQIKRISNALRNGVTLSGEVSGRRLECTL